MDSKPTGITESLHKSTPTLDFDDAFLDEGDDANFHFSPEAIREEMSKHMPSVDSYWNDQIDSSSPGLQLENLSVSTLDMNNDTHHTPAESPPPSSGLESSSELSNDFSQISLSRSNSLKDAEVPVDFSTMSTVSDEKAHNAPYPSIVIDVSNRAIENPTHEPPLTVNSPSRLSIDLPLESAVSTQSLPSPERIPSPMSAEATSRDSSQKAATVSVPSSPKASGNAPIETTSNSSTLLTEAPVGKPGHRHTRSNGPSAFEKVRSRTRPIFLPPKPRKEDDKHLDDWYQMMENSKFLST
jgi:TBC1 domain family member 14